LRERLGPHVTLASRAHGFTDVRVEVDYYLVEDLSIIVGDEVIRRNVVRFVEGLQSKGKPFELHVYIDNPYVEELGDIVGVAESSGAPLHVTVQNPRGGGPVRSLYEQLRRRVGIVYVHTRIYDEVDTRCRGG
jgi:MoaA/NifB/PqqE/SkfB family radical SAM enzyme